MTKPKDQQEGHESEFQEQHSLTIYSTVYCTLQKLNACQV